MALGAPSASTSAPAPHAPRTTRVLNVDIMTVRSSDPVGPVPGRRAPCILPVGGPTGSGPRRTLPASGGRHDLDAATGRHDHPPPPGPGHHFAVEGDGDPLAFRPHHLDQVVQGA